MPKSYFYSLWSVVAVVAIALTIYFSWLARSSVAPVYDKKVYIRYSFLLNNKSNQVIENAKFSMFAPYPLNEKQKLITHTSSQVAELVADADGNSSFKFSELFIPPYGSKTLNINLEVASTTNMAERQEGDLKPYLKKDLFLNMEDPAVIKLAAQFKGQDSNQISKNIYTWLVNHIQVLNYVAQAKGAKYAIEQKTGDCTEMMHTFIALARLNGIPARAVGGFVVENNATVVHANDYHNWAEYYNGKRWVIVDAQKQLFDKTGHLTYVIFRYFDRQKESRQYSQRFITFDESMSVSML
jgi:hypothetical protein